MYDLDKIEVPVEYECVDKIVLDIWKRKPLLVIHCGVNAYISCINLEQYAFNNCYNRADYKGNYLANDGRVCLQTKCKPDNYGMLRSNLNLKHIIETIGLSLQENDIYFSDKCKNSSMNMSDNEMLSSLVSISYDVGNYLCGYIYLKSLDNNTDRCLFVHVPCVDKPLSSKQTSIILEEIIKASLKEILNSNTKDMIENQI